MAEVATLSPADRAREKKESRDDDARALASGKVSRQDLRRENGRFAFPEAKLLIGKAPLY